MFRPAYVFLWIIIFNNLKAQDVQRADRLFRDGNKREALLLYEQIAYEHIQEPESYNYALIKKAQALKSDQKYDAVISTLSRCKDVSKWSDSLKIYLGYERAFAFYNLQQFDDAKQAILPLIALPSKAETRKAIVFLYSLILHELGDWEESHANLVIYYKNNPSFLSNQEYVLSKMDSLFAEQEIPHLKNPNKARRLSMIFPGLGQYYNGNVGKGIINFSLISLSGAFLYYNVFHEAYFTGIVGGGYLATLFYTGGVNQMKTLVNQKNQRKKNIFNQKLNQALYNLHSKY